MLAWDVFRHYLLSRRAGAVIRTVSWLCMAGVGLGVMSLVVVISVMNGFNLQIRERLLSVEPHLVAKVPGVSNPEVLKTHPIYQDVSHRAGVQTEIYENQDVILRTVDGLFGGAVAKGIEAKSLSNLVKATKLSDSLELGPGEILIGADLALSLGIFEGDKVVVIPPEALLLPTGEAPPFERVTVKSKIATNIPDIDAKAIYYSRGQTFQRFGNAASRETGYELKVPDPNNLDDIKKDLEKKGAQVATWRERNSALFYALRMEKFAIGVFLSLSAVIASLSITTVLVLLLTQKRKDIGLMMSVGLSPQKTQFLFMKVGLIPSSIGIGSGIILGIVICLIVDSYPLPILPDIYYDTTIPAKVDPLFIAGILFAASLIAVLSAYIPARSTTRLLPAEALRGRSQK